MAAAFCLSPSIATAPVALTDLTDLRWALRPVLTLEESTACGFGPGGNGHAKGEVEEVSRKSRGGARRPRGRKHRASVVLLRARAGDGRRSLERAPPGRDRARAAAAIMSETHRGEDGHGSHCYVRYVACADMAPQSRAGAKTHDGLARFRPSHWLLVIEFFIELRTGKSGVKPPRLRVTKRSEKEERKSSEF